MCLACPRALAHWKPLKKDIVDHVKPGSCMALLTHAGMKTFGATCGEHNGEVRIGGEGEPRGVRIGGEGGTMFKFLGRPLSGMTLWVVGGR